MRQLFVVVSVVAVAACGGKSKGEAGEPGGAEDDGRPARRETLSLEFTPDPEREGVTAVAIVMVDETGSSSRMKVRSYPGRCKAMEPVNAPGTDIAGELLAGLCTIDSGAGVQLRLVVRRGELILLEARIDGPDAEREYEQRGSFPLPSGAKIEAAPLEPPP